MNSFSRISIIKAQQIEAGCMKMFGITNLLIITALSNVRKKFEGISKVLLLKKFHCLRCMNID